MNALSDLIPQLNKSVGQIMGLLMEKKIVLGIIILMCFLLNVPISLLWYLPPMQPDSHPEQSTSMLVNPLADRSGHIVEEVM